MQSKMATRKQTKTCSTRDCNKPVKALGMCRSCYDKHIYQLSKGNGHSAANGGPACVECGKPLLHHADHATRCGACLKESWLGV